MHILGFDTTASTVSVALTCKKDLLCSYSAASKTTHSTTLLPVIEQLLGAASLKISDIDLICCSAGPGSFTGVRIGCATAKGLAAPFGIPCVGVSSLEAMAEPFSAVRCAVCPALNARRGNVYTAVFLSDGNGNVTRLTEDDLIPVAELPVMLKNVLTEDLPVYIAGDSVSELISAAEGVIKLIEAPALMKSPSGYGAAMSGYRIFTAAGCDRASFREELLAPIYLRKSQAEREKLEKEEKARSADNVG